MTRSWPSCRLMVPSPEGRIGACGGRTVVPHEVCLIHLADQHRDDYFGSLQPGSDIDHRGTRLDANTLRKLTDAVRNPSGHPEFGACQFASVTFPDRVDFRRAIFTSDADFASSTFSDVAEFDQVHFLESVDFSEAKFQSTASFELAIFNEGARFGSAEFVEWVDFSRATFKSLAEFNAAHFIGRAHFTGTKFQGYGEFAHARFGPVVEFYTASFEGTADFKRATFLDARFIGTTFKGVAEFSRAIFDGVPQVAAEFYESVSFSEANFKHEVDLAGSRFSGPLTFSFASFEETSDIGPLACAGSVTLSGATFASPVSIMISAQILECRRTRWASTAVLHLRNAGVDFGHAVFEFPVTIAAEQDPFVFGPGQVLSEFPGADGAKVRIISLRGVDAAHLHLSDVDLSQCLFVGTVHLDQLRLEGDCRFQTPPAGTHWRRGRPIRFTQRRTLAEECDWRSRQPLSLQGWTTVSGGGRIGPTQLAPIYRALRKSFEDSKNEPGAADFYYGEMEMRRRDPVTPPAERHLLTGYWALSGYGLRATRALAWLLLAMIATLCVMMFWGLPASDPKPVSTGRISGESVRLTTDIPDPVNPTGPPLERLSSERFEKSLRVVINSVVFRSSGQDLTTAGTYVEMVSRLTEPILLGLAVLAIRGRVKR